ANNVGTGGMTTPNSGSGPTYKTNNNPAHSGDTGNSGINNIPPKKAVVSVQRPEQSNIPQQQSVAGGPQMVFQNAPLRYYQSEYIPQQGTGQSMQLQQIPFYYTAGGLIQAAAAPGVGQPQNIMMPSGSSSAGPGVAAPPSLYYSGVYP
ncbi:unnamed protein product, partial [Adineta steineri]